MAWPGYFEYAGNEVINVARTESYVKNAGATWLRPQYENESLAHMLGDRRYRTPLLDDAPWLDGDNQASEDFWGLYPLDISGFEDSSRSSTVIESLLDGGNPGRVRNATKTLTFSCALLAGNEAGAEYGMRWLRKVLMGSACGPDSASACNGSELCYLSSEPHLDIIEDINQTPASLDGGYFNAEVDSFTSSEETDGGVPGSTYEQDTDGGAPGVGDVPLADGGSAQGIEFVEQLLVTDLSSDDMVMDAGPARSNPDVILEGGDPFWEMGLVDALGFPFGADQTLKDDLADCLTPILRSFRKVVFNSGPSVTAKRVTTDGSHVWTLSFTAVAGNPYEHGTEMPVIEGFMDPNVTVPWVNGVVPDGASYDLDGFVFADEQCQEPVFRAIYDPANPAMIDPPGPPTIPLGSYVPPLNWTRRQIVIPKEYIPLWGDVVPKIQVHATDHDVRNLRVRFYADPDGTGDITQDPCAFCGDIVVSYVPASHTLIFDGAEQVVRILSPGGGLHRADALVFSTDGTPFDWPALTCGYGYVVTFDLPQTQVPPSVDLSLYSRTV